MIYVDKLKNRGWILRGRSMESCHMFSENIEELHNFARKIGLKKIWFQDTKYPHYDLTPNKRKEAINNYATSISDKDAIKKFKRE